MKRTLEQLIADSSFVRWLNGEGSTEEKKQWDQWLQENPEHQALVREAKEIVLAVDGEYDIPDPVTELEQLNQKIDQHEQHQKLYDKIYSIQSNKQSYRFIGYYTAAAVVIFAVMLGGIIGYNYNGHGAIAETEIIESPEIEEYHTSYGEKLSIRLSDGSQITLNGNSSLTFSSTLKKGGNTEVELKGEAYFDIAHLEGDAQRTFKVQTNDGTIQVLGTRFVVNTFGSETRTVLEEGKVSIQTFGSPASYELSPGELAQYKSGNGKITVKKVDVQFYTSWTENILSFRNNSMKEVARRIEDIFGVEVRMDSQLQEETLSGTIKSDNIEVLKEALEEVLRTKIEQRDNQLLIGVDNRQN